MPFCADIVKYPSCVPFYQTLPPSREYEEGRFFNHTILKKDQWVEESFTTHVLNQIEYEKNNTEDKKGRNENGEVIQRRFYKNKDCRRSYKNLFCYLNFPRCDPDRDLTLPTCRSACENFFKSCQYHKSLWRCGKSKYFNGYEPESPTFDDFGNATYRREYMTGQPFRENKYSKGGSERPICTPAILGSAPSLRSSGSIYIVLLVMTSAFSWMFLYT